MKTFRIAVIAGDGIGKEVVPEGIRVLDAAGQRFGFQLAWHFFDWSCEAYLKTGKMMPADGLDQLRPFDAIFLGAVGRPDVPDHISLWGLLIPIRRGFRQYINLRPVRLFEGVETPLKSWKPDQIDFVIVRENNEGEYSNIGGRVYGGTEDEIVIQETVFTRRGVNRVLRFAFDLAGKRKKHLTSATKSNGIIHTMPFWDECFRALSVEFPDVRTDQYHIDILTAHFVVGSIGIAPSANLNPEREYPSMFEPVHGSAPDIAGKRIANPIGQIWSGALMLRHLGIPGAADAVEAAVAATLAQSKIRTPDIGGNASTQELGEAIAMQVSRGQ